MYKALKRLISVGKVYIVNGPSGSGKTTYVKEHKAPEDIVLDMDMLKQAISGSDSLYHETRASVPLSMLMRDKVLEVREEILLGGRNIWLIMAEPDKEIVMDLVHKYDAELITLDVDKSVCKSRIISDGNRPQKGRFLYYLDDWFSFEDKKLQQKPSLSCDEVDAYLTHFMSVLDSISVDYFVSGSITLYRWHHIALGRPIHDVDIYVNERDIDKVKDWCNGQNIEFHDCRTDIETFATLGHIYYFEPFADKMFHIGVMPFMRSEDDSFMHILYFQQGCCLFRWVTDFTNCGLLKDLFSVHANRVLPFEYSLVFKLYFFRYKDICDFEQVRDIINVDLLKDIKLDLRKGTFYIDVIDDDGKAYSVTDVQPLTIVLDGNQDEFDFGMVTDRLSPSD